MTRLRITWHVLLASLFLIFAGISMLTMPDGPIPSFEWRLHYGLALWFFGAIMGLSIGIGLSPRR